MTDKVVDIVIPIHDQFQLVMQCITSILAAKASTPYEVIAIDDASTDQKLRLRLTTLAQDGRITLLRNEQNIGFTRSVNLGMSLHADRDVLLLNSDTVVYDHWLDRIAAAARSASRIASVNPMTTQRGSHISCYPGLANPYDEPLEVSDERLNRIAREMNAGKYVAVHTTVGFCMYISRACLNEIGQFDSTHFPIAYGEESDFCYRARKAGWRHLIAGDVFVTHLEGKSFTDRKQKLMADMLRTFAALHPEAGAFDARFRERDPVRVLRRGLDLGRVKQLLAGRHAIPIAVKPERARQLGSDPVRLEYDQAGHKVAFAIGKNPDSFPNLDSFRFPQDLAQFNHTMAILGVTALEYRSESCRDAIDRATRGLPFEVGLGVRMIAAA